MVAVAVGGAEVEVRDRRVLAAAQVQRVVLEAGEDRAGEDADVGRQGRVGDDQGRQPAGMGLDVVVDVGQQRRVGLARAGVAGRVEAQRALVGDVARAVAERGGARPVAGPVVDDEHVRAERGRLRDDRRERDVEVRGSPGGGQDDGDGRGHGQGGR